MKSLKNILCTCCLFLLSFEALASTYNFDGELVVYDTSGTPFGPTSASGYVDFDLSTGLGSGGTITEAGAKIGTIFSDIQIAGIGGDLFTVDFTVNVFDSTFTGSLVWEILELVDGSLTVVTVDGNGDSIPGLPLSDETPFPGFSMALNGSLTSVPLPATVWLFGTGLIGLIGLARRKTNS